MFPLRNREIVGFKFGAKTFYNNFHIGVDYANEGDGIYAPFDGVATKTWGDEGGNTLFFKADNRPELFRFLHLQKYVKLGRVKEGELMGIVGHTGLVRPAGIAGSHTHLDISKNGILQINNRYNFLDPEKYDWGTKLLTPQIMHRTHKGTVYAFSEGYWLLIATSGEEYLAEWDVKEFPKEMTDAQFRAFPVHKRTIK